MPTYLPVTAGTCNYASVVFIGFVLIATVWYFVWGHANYQGPAVNLEAETESYSEDHHD